MLRRRSVLPLVGPDKPAQTAHMIFIACPVRGDELIPERRIRSLTNTSRGILVEVDCFCGNRHKVRTGRQADSALVG